MLDRNRWNHRRRQQWWRYHAGRRLVCSLLALATFCVAGCERRDWQKTYFEAQGKLRSGDSDSALVRAEAGYRHFEKIDPLWHWKFRILAAEILLRKRQPEQILALLEPAPEQDLPDEVLVRKDILQAQALCRIGKSADSQRLFDEAAELISPQGPKLRAELEFNLGYCAFQSDRDLARPHFETAAKLAHGVDAYWEARALGALGFALMQDGRYDQAIGKFLEASSIATSPLLREGLLGDLGECYAKVGDWKTAISYSQQAESLASGMKDGTTDRARWLIDLGGEHFSQLQYAKAEGALTKAHAIARELNDKDLQARCLDNLAMLALATGDRENAERYVKADVELNPTGEQRSYLLLNESELAVLKGDLSAGESFLLQVLDSHPKDPRILWRAQSALASVYNAQQKFALAEKAFREAAVTADRMIIDLKDDQSRISFLDYTPFYDSYIRFLIARNREVDALNIAELGRSRALAHGLKISEKNVDRQLDLPRIQRTLRGGREVVLAYWLGWKTESYLWVITSSGVKLFKLPSEKEIDDAIDAYTQEVLDMGAAEESGLGQKLYEMLVAPAEKYIPRGSKLIIVPHRRLYKLNFETLVSPHPKPHFWIEDVCIHNASFVAVLQQPRKGEARYSKDLLLMGAPVQARKDLPGLPHAPEEMQKIAAHFAPAKEKLIEGKDATPAAYQSSDPGQFRFFHFVTHGMGSDTNPLDSAIILSPSSDGYKLYARDIIKTRIHPELVTISTCYGAGTRQYSGEGLVGLAWAFMRVGAHQVVAALWEADDAADADLMDQFYAELTNGKTAAAALRDAKLALLHSKGPRRRPYYWASLQLYTGP